MNRYTLRISRTARDEVAEAIDYIASESSPAAAQQWLDELDAVLQSLAEMPQRFPLARENPRFPHGDLHRALHHKHRILFTVKGDVVRVLHGRHGMRDELTEPRLAGGQLSPVVPATALRTRLAG